MKWIKQYWPLMLGGLAAIVLGAGLGLLKRNVDTPVSLQPLWNSHMADLEGKPLALDTLRGRPLIINFWATWCGPCKEEMPDFQRLALEYYGENLQIVGIGIDNAVNMRAFSKKLGITYLLLDAGTGGIDLLGSLGNTAKALPYTLVINRAGTVVKAHLGRLGFEELQFLARVATAP